jgi:glycosyltransferase involved in cell wall biosynthesis
MTAMIASPASLPRTDASGAARVVVFGEPPRPSYLARRTVRSLMRAGLMPAREPLARVLASAPGPVWLVREGAWRTIRAPFDPPPPSRTGRPLCALGAVVAAPGSAAGTEEERWARVLARTGGDLDTVPAEGLPPLASVWLEPPLVGALGRRWAAGEDLGDALAAVLLEARARVVRHRPLDVHADLRLRVAQLVTSVQQGGAERIAIDLADELPRIGIATSLIALGGPTRAAFAVPAGTVDLAWERRLDRSASLLEALAGFGADVIHGHLLDGADVRRLAAADLPLVLTIHNVRAGWPADTAGLSAADVTLLVGCARAVEADLAAAGLPAPARTVWNGVDFAAYEATPASAASARSWRARLGLAAEDVVLLAVANPRPQKRLHLLPGVLAATRGELVRRGERRAVRLVLAGGGHRDVERAVLDEVRSEAARLDVEDDLRLAGSVDDVAGLLAAADVLVSTSAYEGLSLAQIEALASGLPVVATAAGGAAELASGDPAMALVDVDAPPDAYARAIAEFVTRRPASGRTAAAVHFTRERMARSYARLYPRLVARAAAKRGRGLLLVTNNFSTGGAQSSARRLLLGLRDQGVRVRAAVLEEQPRYPTPGRQALVDAGIEVLALPPPAVADAEEAVGALFDAIDRDPPEAVVLWNALADRKVLLADGLLDAPLFDVSPGEMYYESLERYFQRPRAGLPYRTPAEYAARLAGVIVKYRGETDRAARVLGAPVHVIPNGVPLAAAPARTTDPHGPVVIGTLARLDPRKKVDHLLEAVARANGRLPPHVVRIAGGVERGCGAYAEQLRARGAGCRVEWRGEVLDPRPFLGALDIFALVAEPAGCPNASLEAMSVGVPVVATDAGGMSEQLVDGATGRLVPSGDADALADALVSLAWNAAERARLGAAGQARVREDFSVERMVAAYRRVCLEDHGAPDRRSHTVRIGPPRSTAPSPAKGR